MAHKEHDSSWPQAESWGLESVHGVHLHPQLTPGRRGAWLAAWDRAGGVGWAVSMGVSCLL